MGDSRFHLKAKFSVYGKDFEWDASLNWSAPHGECDERISGWFTSCYEEAYGDFRAAMYEADKERRDAEQESKDRADLARLRAKYPDS